MSRQDEQAYAGLVDATSGGAKDNASDSTRSPAASSATSLSSSPESGSMYLPGDITSLIRNSDGSDTGSGSGSDSGSPVEEVRYLIEAIPDKLPSRDESNHTGLLLTSIHLGRQRGPCAIAAILAVYDLCHVYEHVVAGTYRKVPLFSIADTGLLQRWNFSNFGHGDPHSDDVKAMAIQMGDDWWHDVTAAAKVFPIDWTRTKDDPYSYGRKRWGYWFNRPDFPERLADIKALYEGDRAPQAGAAAAAAGDPHPYAKVQFKENHLKDGKRKVRMTFRQAIDLTVQQYFDKNQHVYEEAVARTIARASKAFVGSSRLSEGEIQKIRDGIKTNMMNRSREFLLEEVAVMGYWLETGYANLYYAGSISPALAAGRAYHVERCNEMAEKAFAPERERRVARADQLQRMGVQLRAEYARVKAADSNDARLPELEKALDQIKAEQDSIGKQLDAGPKKYNQTMTFVKLNLHYEKRQVVRRGGKWYFGNNDTPRDGKELSAEQKACLLTEAQLSDIFKADHEPTTLEMPPAMRRKGSDGGASSGDAASSDSDGASPDLPRRKSVLTLTGASGSGGGVLYDNGLERRSDPASPAAARADGDFGYRSMTPGPYQSGQRSGPPTPVKNGKFNTVGGRGRGVALFSSPVTGGVAPNRTRTSRSPIPIVAGGSRSPSPSLTSGGAE